MLTIRAMSSGAGYAQRHLEQSDYYDEDRKIEGEWLGHGAELLGLEGKVTHEQFEAIRKGADPYSGEYLRPRHGADRIGEGGEEQSKARSLYDLTFSAPKSVSIMAVVAGDERLLEAHKHAVAEALTEAEVYAGARVRLAGANDDRATGNWVVAAYTHDTSRELDPQLHTHAVAANLTFDGAEGRWKALQASGLYERRAYLTEVYRNRLAFEVRSLGYAVENRHDAKGRDRGFEISGVSQDLLEKFSQRSAQRDRAIEQFTQERGRRPTDNEVAVLVRESRAQKMYELPTEELRTRQRERLTVNEAHSLQRTRSQALSPLKEQEIKREQSTASLTYAQEHLFERLSVVKEHALMTESLRHGRGKLSLDHLKGTLISAEAQGALIRARGEITTRESLERERDMVSIVNRGIGCHEPLGRGQDIDLSKELNTEQKRAVLEILQSRDLVVNLRGAAGTGKTATLHEVDRGLKESGREVLAIAPTRSAVEELDKAGFAGAVTVARLLSDPEMQNSLRNKVLIVDEAGMLSDRQMQALLHVANDHHARIVFSGDTRQVQSVEAGDALRILERESSLKSVSLTEVHRQTHALYRDAVKSLRHSPEEGFQKLESLGAVREVPIEDRSRLVAETHHALHAKGKSVLVIAPTHEEIGQLTSAIREHRREHDDLGTGEKFVRDVPLQWTEAQKREFGNYQEGMVLRFHRSTSVAEKHEALQVLRVEPNRLIARNEHGDTVTVTHKQAKAFSVHEHKEIDIAPGDRLLLTSNRRGPEFKATNGEFVTVRNTAEGKIQLEDGRTLPTNYREFDYGYAITAHRSQGRTVDAVIVAADSMKRELFYVAATRGRKEIAVVTSDTDRLRETIGISAARQSATEMARQQPSQNNLENGRVPPSHDISPRPSAPGTTLDGPPRKPQERTYEPDMEPGWGGMSR